MAPDPEWPTRLPYPDRFHLEAVMGWLMLGDAAGAWEDLQRLSPASRAWPDVLEVEWAVHAAAFDWVRALTCARHLLTVAPERSSGWVYQAYSLRRAPGGGLVQAQSALLPAAERFAAESIIPYNLACYAAQLRKLDEAWSWFGKALAVASSASDLKESALADPDLEPIWDRLRQL